MCRLLLIVLTLVSCSKSIESSDYRVIIPKEFDGNSVAIVFGDSAATMVDTVSRRFDFIIPENGVFRVANDNIDLDNAPILSSTGDPIWRDGDIETYVMEELCDDRSLRTLFIFRSSRVTFVEAVAEVERRGFAPCKR